MPGEDHSIQDRHHCHDERHDHRRCHVHDRGDDHRIPDLRGKSNPRCRASYMAALASIMAMTLAMLVPATAAHAKPDSPYKLIYGNMYSHTVFTVDPNGKNHRPFFNSFFGEFSATPDGRLFVYVSQYGQQLMIRDQSGKINQAIKNIKARMPAISPDGTKIAYVEPTDGKTPFDGSPIRVIDLKGKRLATLGSGYNPVFSPDSKKIAFLRSATLPDYVRCGIDREERPPWVWALPDKESGLLVASATSGGSSWAIEPYMTIAGKAGSASAHYLSLSGIPSWSADGSSVLISGRQTKVYSGPGRIYSEECLTDHVPLGSNRLDLYQVSAAGGKPARLSSDIKQDSKAELNSPTLAPAAYSPDGSQIAFYSRSRHEIWMMKANGAAAHRVFKTPNGAAVESRLEWFLAHPGAQVVTVKATKKCAYEQGKRAGVFTVSRTTSAGKQKVTLAVTKKSTATAGKDYKKFDTTVTIPNGKKKVKVKVKPKDDRARESDETVIVTITKAGGMVIGNPSTATVTIADNDGGPASGCR